MRSLYKFLIGFSIVVTASTGYVLKRDRDITSKLDTNAVKIPMKPLIDSHSLPDLFNEDVDNDGKIESIIIDYDSSGSKFYQEITRNPDGSFKLSEPMPYK